MPRQDDTAPEQLIVRAKAGDRAALGRLLEMYRNYLGLLARVQTGRWLQGRVGASDIVQDTYLAAHRDFGVFRGTTEEELVDWLRRIMANRLIDTVRRNRAQARDPRLERRMVLDMEHSSRALNAELIDPHGTPSQHAVRRERAVLLADALEELPSNYREVIVLRHMERLSFAEVAARLGRTQDSVQNLWVRALAKLKKSLRDPP